MRLRCVAVVAALPLSSPLTTASAQDPIRVVRHAPVDTARSGDVITVSFDRPVVGSLDQTPDATRIVHVEPPLAAQMQWRDAATLRIIPIQPLTPGRRYRFTVSNAFAAIDGGRLEAPYEFTLITHGPRLLVSVPTLYPQYPSSLTPNGTLQLIYSAPVDSAAFGRTARIEITAGKGCERRSIPYAIRAQREIAKTDDYNLQYAGGWDRDTTGDRFRRILELKPASRPPEDCSGEIVLPSLDPMDRAEIRYPIATARRFALESLHCAGKDCAAGRNLWVQLSAPVFRDSLARHMRFEPAVPFTIVESGDPAGSWALRLEVRPRTTYRVTIDSSLTDVFDRRLGATASATLTTGDRTPALGHQLGFFSVPRTRPVLHITHVNVDSAELVIVPIPDSLRATILDGHTGADSAARMIARLRDTVFQRVRIAAPFNVERVSEVPISLESLGPAQGSLFAIRARMLVRRESMNDTVGIQPGVRVRGIRPAIVVSASSGLARLAQHTAIVQFTDLIANAKVADGWGAVFVTSATTGQPVRGATVTTRDAHDVVIATGVSDSSGVAELRQSAAWRPSADATSPREWYYNPSGSAVRLIEVSRATDRLILPTTTNGWSQQVDAVDRLGGVLERSRPVRAMVFADRGIYRPGETVYVTAALRRGHSNALRVPARGDSVRLRITHHVPGEREPATVRDTVLRVNDYGTVSDSLVLGRAWALGIYSVYVDATVYNKWQNAGAESFQLAEYRVPAFETSLTLDTTARYLGDTLRAEASGRYYFGAPMSGAVIHWSAYTVDARDEFTVPGLPAGFSIGEAYVGGEIPAGRSETLAGVDTLDATGRVQLRIPTRVGSSAWPARVDVSVSVDDLDRQSVSSDESIVLHGSNLYVAVRDRSPAWYWRPNEPRRFEALAVRPNGDRVTGISMQITVVRYRRTFESTLDESARARWVVDTLVRASITSRDSPVSYEFTPRTTGSYGVVFSARDDHGRTVASSVGGYVFAGAWMAWDDNPARLPIRLDRDSLALGDTLTVRFISPFTRGEAWVTVEREEILAQRRVRVSSGESVVRIPVLATFISGAHVSVVVADSGTAWTSDSTHQRIRAGYTRFSVDPASKTLVVDVRPEQRKFAPGDSVSIVVNLRDRQSRPVAGQVTLWAIDEGVAALTDYSVSDPVSAMHGGYGTGLMFATSTKQLRSNARLLAPPGWTIGLSDSMDRAMMLGSAVAAYGSAAANSAVFITRQIDPRRDFRSTAFYITSLPVGPEGEATARVKLPDNLTTYHVFAVAMTTDDRYGKGESSFVVTKPLFARASLPRFFRTGDVVRAGAVANNTTANVLTARVEATARGITRVGTGTATRSLAGNAGAEVRFDWRADGAPGDSAVIRFDVQGGTYADAVETTVPVRAPYSPRYHAVAGVARGDSIIRMSLPHGINPVRSRLTLRVGASPLPIIRAAYEWVSVYPFYCSEQLTSAGNVILSVLRLQQSGLLDSAAAPTAATLRGRLQFIVDELARRQAVDGGIGYWNRSTWTDPWISSYAGTLLVEARAAGFDVDSMVIDRIVRYVTYDPDTTSWVREEAYGTRRQRETATAWRLSQQLAVLHFRRLAGAPDTTLENGLVGASSRMMWEDRVWLAELLSGRRDRSPARKQLQQVWRDVEMAGVRVDIPDSLLRTLGFRSHVRPVARLLRATMAIDSGHPRLAALIERVVQQGRAERDWAWNTQDYAEATTVLADLAIARARSTTTSMITVRSARAGRNSRVLLSGSNSAPIDSAVSLEGLLETGATGMSLPLRVESSGAPVFYSLTVDEVPLEPPTRPDAQGIIVERWYERFDDGKPVTEVTEGDLVRGRLRITVPADREFVAVEDLLPAGLEVVDVSLRTSSFGPFQSEASREAQQRGDRANPAASSLPWLYGNWADGWWSPWEHKEIRDDRVVYFARMLWKGSYTATYVARATTAGTFVRPPAHAEEMYNQSLGGRSDGGTFKVVPRQ
jgi:uncharacterized protein YfaS (alpha-2-macroglobulin family)